MATTKCSSITKRRGWLALISSGALVCAAAAVDVRGARAETPAAGQAGAAQKLGPEVRSAGDVRYVSGGIGDSGEARTRELGRDMSLQLVFAQAPGGNYVADVDVSIADRSGKTVLEVDSANPLLFAQLPPGTYRVTATARGQSLERTVEVPSRGQRTAHFHWPAAQASVVR